MFMNAGRKALLVSSVSALVLAGMATFAQADVASSGTDSDEFDVTVSESVSPDVGTDESVDVSDTEVVTEGDVLPEQESGDSTEEIPNIPTFVGEENFSGECNELFQTAILELTGAENESGDGTEEIKIVPTLTGAENESGDGTEEIKVLPVLISIEDRSGDGTEEIVIAPISEEERQTFAQPDTDVSGRQVPVSHAADAGNAGKVPNYCDQAGTSDSWICKGYDAN